MNWKLIYTVLSYIGIFFVILLILSLAFSIHALVGILAFIGILLFAKKKANGEK